MGKRRFDRIFHLGVSDYSGILFVEFELAGVGDLDEP